MDLATHGKADARGLTGAEIAGRELKAQERRAAKGVNTPCVTGPSHLESPQAAPLESPPSSPGVLGLPVSTSPALLQEEEAPGKRKRTVTVRYTEARRAGLPIQNICCAPTTSFLVLWLCGGREWCPRTVPILLRSHRYLHTCVLASGRSVR